MTMLQNRHDANVGEMERTLCAISGLALSAWGICRRGPVGWAATAAGSGLLWHGAKQHSYAYEMLGIDGRDADTWSHPFNRSIASRHSVTIARPADELYRQWRKTGQLDRFLPHVESVVETGERTSTWTARIPGGRLVEWDAAITEDREGERIAWQASDEAVFEHRGSINFQPAPGDRGTQVTLELSYTLPGGAVGALLARLLGSDPDSETTEALRRFKQWIEAGEVTSARGPACRGDGWNEHSLRSLVGGDHPQD